MTARTGAAALVLLATLAGAPPTAHGSTPPAEPVAPTHIAWRTELPEGLGEAVPGGPGLLMVGLDTVVAIDTATGEIAWRYESETEQPRDIFVTQDGLTAIAISQPVGGAVITVLDAATGAERFAVPASDLTADATPIAMTNEALVWSSDSSIGAQSLNDFGLLWTTPFPDGCGRPWPAGSPLRGWDAGVVVQCESDEDGRVEYLLLDGASGAVGWTHQGASADARESVAPDASVIYLGGWTIDGGGPSPTGAIVDVESGDVVRAGPWDGQLLAGRTGLSVSPDGTTITFVDLVDDNATEIERPCPCSQPLAYLPSGIVWSRVTDAESAPVAFQAVNGDVTEFEGVSTSDFPNSVRAMVAGDTIVVGDGDVSLELVGLR